MIHERVSFGACVINNFIYAAGGMSTGREVLSSIERYDILTDKWEMLKGANLPLASYSMCFYPVRQRLIYMFGDMDKHRNKEMETIYRLDTYAI
jgi:hypothetical protein